MTTTPDITLGLSIEKARSLRYELSLVETDAAFDAHRELTAAIAEYERAQEPVYESRIRISQYDHFGRWHPGDPGHLKASLDAGLMVMLLNQQPEHPQTEWRRRPA